jgi:hypothetical protein
VPQTHRLLAVEGSDVRGREPERAADHEPVVLGQEHRAEVVSQQARRRAGDRVEDVGERLHVVDGGGDPGDRLEPRAQLERGGRGPERERLDGHAGIVAGPDRDSVQRRAQGDGGAVDRCTVVVEAGAAGFDRSHV